LLRGSQSCGNTKNEDSSGDNRRHLEVKAGQLQISLVSFGIELFPATNAASEISFHQIDHRTGERIHHLKVIDGNDPVEKSEIVKGYEDHPGKYVIVEPEEVERLRIESKRTVEIAQFISLDEIPLAAFEKPYFVVPSDDWQSAAFAVVRKAFSKQRKQASEKSSSEGANIS
jgi:DNA end-binding protein Ku